MVAPARHRATGKLGLRHTHRGFGTPFFVGTGGDEQIRVDGGTLVREVGDRSDTLAPGTLADGDLWNAESFAGAQLPYQELLTATDPYRTALDFFMSRFERLNPSTA